LRWTSFRESPQPRYLKSHSLRSNRRDAHPIFMSAPSTNEGLTLSLSELLEATYRYLFYYLLITLSFAPSN
jgi:hypothetical protein